MKSGELCLGVEVKKSPAMVCGRLERCGAGCRSAVTYTSRTTRECVLTAALFPEGRAARAARRPRKRESGALPPLPDLFRYKINCIY